MASPIAEPTARKISPVLFVLAGICFLLPFSGVSCNTDTAKSTLAPLIAAGGQSNPQQLTAFNSCLDALNNFTLVTYSGANLLLGSAPSVNNNSPSECTALSQSAGQSASVTPSDPNSAKLDPQIWVILAVICIIGGLVISILPVPFRGLITAVLAIVAIVFLLIEQSKAASLIAAKITQSAGSSASSLPAGVDIGSFLKTTPLIGAILCMIVLGVAALYNLASQFAGGGSRLATADATAGGGYVPSAGYGAGPPQAGYGPGPTTPGGYGAPPYQPPAPQPPPGGYPPPAGYPPPGPPQGPPPGP